MNIFAELWLELLMRKRVWGVLKFPLRARQFFLVHHLTCGISSLLNSVNLIPFTLLLVHIILRISPHHSHHLRSHDLSLPRLFTPGLKLISFTNPFHNGPSYSFRNAFTDLYFCSSVPVRLSHSTVTAVLSLSAARM